MREQAGGDPAHWTLEGRRLSSVSPACTLVAATPTPSPFLSLSVDFSEAEGWGGCTHRDCGALGTGPCICTFAKDCGWGC